MLGFIIRSRPQLVEPPHQLLPLRGGVVPYAVQLLLATRVILPARARVRRRGLKAHRVRGSGSAGSTMMLRADGAAAALLRRKRESGRRRGLGLLHNRLPMEMLDIISINVRFAVQCCVTCTAAGPL